MLHRLPARALPVRHPAPASRWAGVYWHWVTFGRDFDNYLREELETGDPPRRLRRVFAEPMSTYAMPGPEREVGRSDKARHGDRYDAGEFDDDERGWLESLVADIELARVQTIPPFDRLYRATLDELRSDADE